MIISKGQISSRDIETIPMSRDDMDKMEALTIQIFLLLGAAMVSIGGRLYIRWRQVGMKNLGLEDVLAIAGVILFVPNVVLAYIMNTQTHWMGNHSISDNAGTQLSSVEYQTRELGSKLYLYSWLSYSAALWMFKAAFLANVLRRTSESCRRQMHQYIGFGFLLVTWVATTMAFLQSCRPLSHMWQVYPNPGRYCQPATSPVLVWVYFSFDTITNLYLASAAIPVATRNDKPTWEKLQWVATLVCGLLATAAAVARAVILVSNHHLNAERTAESWAIWQIFIYAAAIGLTEVFYHPAGSPSYPPMRDIDDVVFNNYIYSERFSTRQHSLAESEATIVVTPEVTNLYEKFADASIREIEVQGRRNSGIQRKVEVSVLQENFVIAPEGPCEICGNYTRSWANDEDANKPEQRSSFFGSSIHFHVPKYGINHKELHESAF
ncbi:uncharacterized protein TRIVIDRAFT_231906 [Trichoderma virens Gv29-8]|uniref:Rhodopsin domain-containing protein n=1 Tax=Hypocrea virens (strain Gv29-8 / FGSC 10586) TaxID=413071 RepID=G9N7C7_HYPVG|nr:uncharacterized protein TRIVIDRAFT_231906 [Trichoderma virens Gv29-8]EHK17624.1 hypothetical protein TRIVIDRAFT_231906 [Trichoderma virens Gv29-8]